MCALAQSRREPIGELIALTHRQRPSRYGRVIKSDPLLVIGARSDAVQPHVKDLVTPACQDGPRACRIDERATLAKELREPVCRRKYREKSVTHLAGQRVSLEPRAHRQIEQAGRRRSLPHER